MAMTFAASLPAADAAEITIKLGNTAPYSGPASAYGTIARAEAAYFQMLNDQGGIEGRKIEFLTLDDGYSPAKTVEQTRKLVEQDDVLAMFSSVGTAPNISVQKYLNARQVPQLFVSSGATRWNDPEHFPWTVGFNPTYELEGRLYAEYILKTKPNAKIAVIAPNEDAGKDYVRGFKAGLGEHVDQLVSETTYLTADPTIDSQMVTMRESGADVFFAEATPKFAAQAIKKLAELDWHPVHIMTNVSASVGAVLKPAGLDNSKGILSAGYQMDVTDPQWDSYPGMQRFRAFMAKYYPEADRSESGPLNAFNTSTALVEVLKRCGDNLTRANVMKLVADMDFEINTYIPGIRIKTSPTDFYPIEQVQMMKFTGEKWELFGPILDGHAE
jgi:branched-chain amino acid transport system substrate-binding protein